MSAVVSRRVCGCWLLLIFSASAALPAGDWPQILGPNRNGIAVEEKLAAEWPKSGPKQLWEAPVGSGYAGVSVSQGVVIIFHRLKDARAFTTGSNALCPVDNTCKEKACQDN